MLFSIKIKTDCVKSLIFSFIGRENKVLVLKSNLLILDKSVDILAHSLSVCSKIEVKSHYELVELDAFEALCARFARSADLVTQKILPSVFAVLQENPKTFLDRVNFAEKIGLFNDAEQIKEIREVRNIIAHEYTLDDISKHFGVVVEYTTILLEIIRSLVIKIKKKVNL